MTLQQYALLSDIKIRPHSLDKELEQLNAKDTLELNKSKPGRGLSTHSDREDESLVFTNLHFNLNHVSRVSPLKKHKRTNLKDTLKLKLHVSRLSMVSRLPFYSGLV